MALPNKEQFLRSFDTLTKRCLWVCATLIIIGYSYYSESKSAVPAAKSRLDQIIPAEKSRSWVCPMHPEIIRDHPGVCPVCGMDLVEMEHTTQHGIHVDATSQKKMGVRLVAAGLQTMSQDIHAYGNVIADESLSFNLSSKLEGVIKKLHVKSVGQRVEAGQVIYEIYSPELLKAQFEYVELLKEKNIIMAGMMSEDAHTSGYTMTDNEMMEVRINAKNRNLYTEKFQYYDAEGLIRELNDTYNPKEVVEICAPQSGFITKIDIHEGSAVKPADNLISFASQSRVLIDVSLFPDQIALVKNGDEATVRIPKSNAPEIKASLQYVSPVVDSATRTVQARLSVKNAANRLLIGSFLDVIIHTRPHNALVVPRSAVMRTGKGDWVILAEGEGHFMPVKVTTGIENTDYIEIIDGLKSGDQVAVNGQFLLDAATSMSSAAQRMHSDADKH